MDAKTELEAKVAEILEEYQGTEPIDILMRAHAAVDVAMHLGVALSASSGGGGAARDEMEPTILKLLRDGLREAQPHLGFELSENIREDAVDCATGLLRMADIAEWGGIGPHPRGSDAAGELEGVMDGIGETHAWRRMVLRGTATGLLLNTASQMLKARCERSLAGEGG